MRRLAALLVAACLALSGCGFTGLYGAPLPGGADLGDHPYSVTIFFANVLDLVPQSTVKVNDVPVGRVESVDLSGDGDDSGDKTLNGWTAKVKISVNSDVTLPANARAEVRITSLLGEKFVALEQPIDAPADTDLKDGSTIPITHTGSAPEIEDVLGALSLLLNGGGLPQIRTITTELNKALDGNSAAVRDLLGQLNSFVGTLNDQKDQIFAALDSVDALTKTLNANKQIIEDTLDTMPQALEILKNERGKFTTLLTSLSNLGSVATRVITATQQNLVSALKSLAPALEQLTASGSDLPESLKIAGTFPFPVGTTLNAVKGDYANLHAFIDLNLSNQLCAINEALCTLASKLPASTTSSGGASAILQPTLVGVGGDAAMILRSTKIQLVLFVIITLLGVTYVSANYVGLTEGLFGPDSCTVKADFPDSGGIFANAEVTYRGVAVGKVSSLELIDSGVQVNLKIDNCAGQKIPASTTARVSDRSVIGEQYVDLVPTKDETPYLASGDTIPQSRTSIPVSAQQLLTSLDGFVNSVDTKALRTVVVELGQAFNQRGDDLARLLDSSNTLLTAAEQNLPATISLIENAATVLDTQLDEAQPLASFAHSLNLLSAQLKTSNPDIEKLLTDSPGDLDVVRNFVQSNGTDLGVVIANLASTGRVLVRHLDGIEQIFELYPALAAGGQSVITSDGIGQLGLIANNINDPPDCGDPRKGSEGYDGTTIRSPGDLRPAAPNVGARCTAPVSSGTNIRGSAHVPGGDPISATGGGVAYPRGTTGNTIRVGTSLNQAGLLGDRAWVALLTDGLH